MANDPFTTGNPENFFIPERTFEDDRKYYGGWIAQRGFNYQVSYICWRLTELLSRGSRLKAVRVEGLQDVDLKFAPANQEEAWKEEYIQVKTVKGQWTLHGLGPILQRFLDVLKLLTPDQRTCVSFRLVVSEDSFNKELERNLARDVVGPGQHALRFQEGKAKPKDKITVKNSLVEYDSLQQDLDWLFQQDRVIIEVKGRDFFPRPVESQNEYFLENYTIENAVSNVNQDHLSYQTAFESIAVDNLQEYAMIKPELRHAAFNALRCKVYDASGGTGSRVFTKRRVLDILQHPYPYIAESALGIQEGIKAINKKFLNEQKQEARSEDEEVEYRESQGETIPAYERPFQGRRARWQDIAANRDLPRSCLEELYKRIDGKAKLDYPAGLVITGTNGEGKSALLMRTAAANLYRDATVYEIIAPPTFSNKGFDPLVRLLKIHPSDRPILFLWDDIYETVEWKYVSRQLKDLTLPMNGAPVLLLATASDNTIPWKDATVSGFLEFFPLSGATENEKETIESKFPEAKGIIEVGQSFLVSMLQAIEAKGFAEIIQGWLYTIHNKSEQGYSCLLLACVPARLGLGIPATLLNNLGFADCLDRPDNYGLRGLLQRASAEVDLKQWGQRMEGPHPVLSQVFLDEAVGPQGIASRYQQLTERIDADSFPERRFFLHLLWWTIRSVESGADLVKGVLRDNSGLVAQCRRSGTVKELDLYWPAIYRAIGQGDEAAKCRQEALDAKPINSGEVVLLAERLAQAGQQEPAVRQLATWIEEKTREDIVDAHTWEKYLELLARKPKDRSPTQEEYEERRAVLRRTEAWLLDYQPPVAGVWVQYLQLANRYGTPLDRGKALGEVANRLDIWREKYPLQCASILEKYIKLLTRKPKGRRPTKGEYSERQALLHSIETWLFDYETPLTRLWVQYLGLANEYGTGLDRDKAIREVANRLETWREKYPEQGATILEKYLKVVDKWREAGSKKEIIDAVNRGADDNEIDEIIEKWVKTPRIHEALSIIPHWITFRGILPQALSFTVRWGKDKDWRTIATVMEKEILSQFRRRELQVRRLPHDLWSSLMSAIRRRGTEEDVRRLILLSRDLLDPTLFTTEPLPVFWWSMFLNLLQLMNSKGTGSLQTIPQGTALSLVLGRIPDETQWQNLKQVLGVDWKNPSFLNENETVLSELGSLLWKCPTEVITDQTYDCFAKMCQKFPQASILHLHCANLAFKAGQLEEATRLYNELIHNFEKWPDPLYHYSRLLLSREEYEPAIQALRKGLTYRPQHIAMRLKLVRALEGQGKTQEAEKERRIICSFQAVGPYRTG